MGVESSGAGICPPVGRSGTTPSFSSAFTFFSPHRWGQVEGPGGRSGQPSVKGRGGGSRSLHPGLLRQAFCRPKAHGRVETSLGPVSTQCLPGEETFRHGDSSLHSPVHQTRRLGNVTRPQRRLFSCSDSPKVSQVPEILLEGSSFPIQNPSLRTLPGSLRVYKGRRRFCRVYKVKRHQVSRLSRRLALPGRFLPSLRQADLLRATPGKNVGLQGQQFQIGAGTLAGIHLLGHGNLHSDYVSQAVPGQTHQALSTPVQPQRFQIGKRQEDSLAARHDGVSCAPHHRGPHPKETTAEATQTPVVHELQHAREADLPATMDKSTCTDMVDSSMAESGCTAYPSSSIPGDFYRCIPLWLGCPHGPALNFGTMVPGPVPPSHQRTGAPSGESGSPPFPLHLSPCFGKAENRQHYGGVLHQQTGGGEILLPVHQGGGNAQLVQEPGHNLVSPPRGRQAQCSGRPVEQVPSNHPHRVDDLPLSPPDSVGRVVQTDGGPLCLQVQSQASNVCVSGSGTSGLEDRRPVLPLDRSDSLRLPASSSVRKSHHKGKARKAKIDSDSSKGSTSPLVPKPSSANTHPSNRASTIKQHSPSTKNGHRTFKPNGPQTSRLDAVRRKLRSSGASRSTSKFVGKGLKEGSNEAYQVAWKKWCFWLKDKKDERGRSYSPYRPPPMLLANFLSFLRDVKGLAPSYIKVIRSAINSSISQMGVKIPESPCLTSLMKGIENDDITQRRNRRIPAWDVFLVLAYLRRSEFSLRNISADWLAMKTLFLVALASSRRPAEWHAFSGLEEDISYERDGSITLRFLPDFVMKTQRFEDPAVFTVIKPLTNILAPDDEDRNLCPVAFLRAYITRSKKIRALTQRRLFISLNPNYEKDIAKPTLSRWVSKVIKAAYDHGKVELPSARAYEVRAISTSLARKHSISMELIMDAAYWRGNSTFISHYLRDTARLKGNGTFGIASVICAQSLIQA